MTKVKKQYGAIEVKSASLSRVLKKVRKLYKAESEPDHLVIPYVLTCAAYLEAKLNESLFEFGMPRFGEDVAATLTTVSLPKKLDMFVTVLTDGRYRINKRHFVYQRLISLIRVRNTIAHPKSEIIEEEDVAVRTNPTLSVPLGLGRMPRQFFGGPDMTLGASRAFTPLQYHEALEKLERWFFRRYPDRLRKVAMIVDRSKEPQWKTDRFVMVRFFD